LGLRAYGVDALGALRIEKGHVAGGEIDGTTTLDDLGLGRMASTRKAFVGDALRRRPALLDPDRQALVGLECLEPGKRLRSGAILFAAGDPIAGSGSAWSRAACGTRVLRSSSSIRSGARASGRGSCLLCSSTPLENECVAEAAPASAIRLRELTDWSLVQIAGWPDTIAALEAALAGVGWPIPPAVGEVASAGPRLTLRIAPEHFWLLDERGSRTTDHAATAAVASA
jgi:hypothetical protein